MSRALLNRMLKEAQLDMAEFLNTSAITHHLNEIIRGARGERLLLISPYLKFSRQIKELLEEQARNWKTPIYVVYGKTELRSEETQWLAENDVRTFFREPLHAKCYMNDSHALITSMNLYEFSQQNNDEMGILVSAEDDEDLYKAIKAEAEHILILSKNVRIDVPEIDDPVPPVVDGPVPPQVVLPKQGFCVRDRKEIPFDQKRPYCGKCYGSWAKFKKEDYKEKYCHACGEKHATSMAKPVCISCYQK